MRIAVIAYLFVFQMAILISFPIKIVRNRICYCDSPDGYVVLKLGQRGNRGLQEMLKIVWIRWVKDFFLLSHWLPWSRFNNEKLLALPTDICNRELTFKLCLLWSSCLTVKGKLFSVHTHMLSCVMQYDYFNFMLWHTTFTEKKILITWNVLIVVVNYNLVKLAQVLCWRAKLSQDFLHTRVLLLVHMNHVIFLSSCQSTILLLNLLIIFFLFLLLLEQMRKSSTCIETIIAFS
jgi:hypothetical protein